MANKTRLLVAIVLVGSGIAIAAAWGFGALVVYCFFAALAGALAYAASAGGEWIAGASRGRFDDDRSGRR